jgi:hypothetical protein
MRWALADAGDGMDDANFETLASAQRQAYVPAAAEYNANVLHWALADACEKYAAALFYERLAPLSFFHCKRRLSRSTVLTRCAVLGAGWRLFATCACFFVSTCCPACTLSVLNAGYRGVQF